VSDCGLSMKEKCKKFADKRKKAHTRSVIKQVAADTVIDTFYVIILQFKVNNSPFSCNHLRKLQILCIVLHMMYDTPKHLPI